ncbi:ROK family protein [Halovivax asiaticus JCM 14624]|uniref:ROK family protein n=1 Tax=Halovivax asiaticus JCM 14624 TaxID=1227490 RepID=M0BDL8_9EURY|nr:ROK family protein [Halovivax asiaticus]ELZ08920.1 ROK family protein [Halovivax asiaticus JCM 14624]
MTYFAGVDLGATNVRAIVGDHAGEPIATSRRRTPQGPTGIDVTEAVLATLRDACADAGIEPTAIEDAAIGSIGPFDLAEGAVVDPANLSDSIDRIPLTGPVERLVAVDGVALHNDATAGVIGERFYAARNPDDMCYVTISSGIGAGICCDGSVLAGWDGNAGEIGHIVVDPDGALTCGCGRAGHWEAYCSGRGIPTYARELARRSDLETALPLEADDFDAATVFAAADSDPLAGRVIDRVADWNTIGIATLVHAVAPMVVSIGGAVATNNPERVIDPVRERLQTAVISNVPDVRPSSLGDSVVLRGALASAITGGSGDASAIAVRE